MSEFWLDNGWMRIAVLDYGATLVEVRVPDRSGASANIVLTLPDLAAYQAAEDRAYVGSTMGRFARIVPFGALVLDGRLHRLVPNAGPHHIHGGPDGFDARMWNGRAAGGDRSGRVVLTLDSPDGDQGYPGALSCTATFELDDDNRLTVRYEAGTDRTTWCGLSSHAFWNLGGSDAVDAHVLHVNAHEVLEADADFVPTGRVLPVAGTRADFRMPRALRGVPVDGFFPLAADAGADAETGSGPTWAARLSDPGSGRLLVVGTDQSGMAVYTGDHLPGRPRAGVCLQPGPWPVAAGPDELPSSLLRPGQTYSSITTFAFALG